MDVGGVGGAAGGRGLEALLDPAALKRASMMNRHIQFRPTHSLNSLLKSRKRKEGRNTRIF